MRSKAPDESKTRNNCELLPSHCSEYGRLQREADRLRTEDARCNGNKKSHEDIIRHFQRELQSDLYRDTEARHKDMLGKLKASVMMCCWFAGMHMHAR